MWYRLDLHFYTSQLGVPLSLHLTFTCRTVVLDGILTVLWLQLTQQTDKESARSMSLFSMQQQGFIIIKRHPRITFRSKEFCLTFTLRRMRLLGWLLENVVRSNTGRKLSKKSLNSSGGIWPKLIQWQCLQRTKALSLAYTGLTSSTPENMSSLFAWTPLTAHYTNWDALQISWTCYLVSFKRYLLRTRCRPTSTWP